MNNYTDPTRAENNDNLLNTAERAVQQARRFQVERDAAEWKLGEAVGLLREMVNQSCCKFSKCPDIYSRREVCGTCAYCRSKALLSASAESSVSRAPQGVNELVKALEQIERWDGFPTTRKTWPESGEPMSFGACFGSNGERDYMRGVAAKALAAHRTKAKGSDNE